MKQWLLRRGLFATLPVAALLAVVVDACSSEPGGASATGTGQTNTASALGTQQSAPSEEILPTAEARNRLARLAQFARIVRVAKKETAALRGSTLALSKLQPAQVAAAPMLSKSGFEEELRAVVSTGEAEHFVKRNQRIRAEVGAKLKHEALRPATIDLPPTAEGFVRVQADEGQVGIEFAAKGAKAGVSLETADGLVNYPGAAPGGGDMVLRVARETVEDFVVMNEKPDHAFVDYRVKVSEVAGLRLYDDTLEFLSASGNPEVRVSPPELVDAEGIVHPAQLTVPDCAVDTNAAAPWGRPVTAPGSQECTLRVRWDDARVTYPAIVDPVWSAGGTLAKARYRNAAVKMSNGNIITCGGLDTNGDPLKSCEIYNSASNTWATGPSLATARTSFTLVALGTDVLAVGDQTSATSEICNCTSATPAWTATATNFSTGNFSLTQLEPVVTSDNAWLVLVDLYGKAFRYQVSTKTWAAGASNTLYRYAYSVLAVPGGTSVLRCGGTDGAVALKTCEKYSPNTDLWVMPGAAGAVTNMNGARSYAAWAALDATKVLVYGGTNGQTSQNIPSAEIYNGAANTWTDIGAIPSGFGEYELHNTWALHGGSNKIFSVAMSTYNVAIFDPATTSWTQLSTYDGSTSFSLMYNGEGGVASAGNKVLVVPVMPNGGQNSPQTACKLFDFVAQGGTCQQTSDCKAGLTCYYDDKYYAPDGLSVCCDTTCTDACSSCRAANKESGIGEGTCGPRSHTEYIGSNYCAYTDPTSCGTVGSLCDGKGACAKYDTNTICTGQSCADGDTQNNARFCDGKGACSTATASDCTAGYACQYSQCQTKCYDDSYCATSYYCQYWSTPLATANQCLPRKAAGNTCSNNSTTECSSGNCVDGFCCDKACNGLCEACSNAITGKTNGVCNPVPAGQASNKDCFDQGSASCGQTGFCDGARACQKYSSSTQCADVGTCATETSRYIPDLCDGVGTCVDKGTQACAPGYACNAGVCQTQCTADTQCASAYYCDVPNKICVLDKKQGQTCLRDQACEGNSNCVEIDSVTKLGVCCNSGCAGDCQSCLKVNNGAADGTCGNVVDDLDPKNKCAQGAAYPNSCAAPGLCNGQGACRPYAKDTVECDTDSCADSTLTTYTCNGAGTCKAKATQCYPFKCDTANNTCRIACSVDTHCVTGSFCKNGTCVGQLVNGSACTDGAQCKSTHCANFHEGVLQADIPTGAGGDGAGGAANDPGTDAPGVCCDSDCQGTCNGCKASIKGFGSDGVCEFVKNNTDPANDCEKAGGDLCGLDGQCNGAGACRLSPSGTSCGASSCQGNSVLGQSCNGQGDCINNQGGIDCAPYVCRDVEGAFQCTNPCATDNDCQDGYFCSDAKCSKKLTNGKACDSSGICGSGYCVDGVCCDTSCNGQCEACDAPTSEGTCTPVQGDPHGARAKCDHPGEECGGQCDGVNASSCKYAATGTTCGDVTCDSDLAKSSACDGQGTCKANKDTECSPYTCGDDNSCLSRCQQDLDCSQGYACDETTQRCLPSAVAATCSDDRLTSVGQNGQNTPCKPFLCVPASGTCAFSCAFTTDCAPDFVCEPSTKTCLPAPTGAGTADDQSCACRAAGAAPDRSGPGYWALAAFGIALTGLRRRKRSRPSARSSTKPASFGLNS